MVSKDVTKSTGILMMKRFFLLVVIFVLLPFTAQGSSLKIGVLLIEDSVPLWVAQQEKMFGAEGVNVELIPFLSALERDSALAAKALDGAVSDPVGAVLFDQGRGNIKITSLLLGEKPDEGVFAILASPKSGFKSVADLKNTPIAISNATIIDYVTDRLLEAEGFVQDEIKTIEVKKMPIRMQMLLSDAVKAATLPEPLASIAESKGAKILLSDAQNSTSLSQTVMIFRREVLEQNAETVERFFLALEKGVRAINNDPDKYRSLFMEKGRIPPFLAGKYVIPSYPLPRPFPKEYYEPVINWLSTRNLVKHLSYEQMVAAESLQ